MLIQCNYPGCQQHAEKADPNVIWDCGNHKRLSSEHSPGCALQFWREIHRYLPIRHPDRQDAPKCNCGHWHYD